jgi:hypothetical protein
MYMRSITYIATVALAATQGMEFPGVVKFVFEPEPRFQSRVVAAMTQLSDALPVMGAAIGQTQTSA